MPSFRPGLGKTPSFRWHSSARGRFPGAHALLFFSQERFATWTLSVSKGQRQAKCKPASFHHTRHELSGYIGCPFLQLKALAKASKFCTDPFTRHRSGECSSVNAHCRAIASRVFPHHT